MSTVESREWAKFFPAEIQTETESALFIHRLFTVTLSELTAKRRIFSHDHFSSKKLGPLSVSLFTRPTSVAEQKRFDATVFSWIQGVSQTISAGYLKMATFFVISKSDDTVLEMYEYYFAYSNGRADLANDSFSSTTSTDELQQQVIKALEAIQQFTDERVKPMADRSTYRFCLKIQYNTAETPHDYQPTGFSDSREIVSPINWKRILSVKMSSSRRILAQIKTTHHKMMLVFRIPTAGLVMKN